MGHARTSAEKAAASRKVARMSVTEETFHAEMSASKEEALRKVARMSVTALTSQAEMFWSNATRWRKSSEKFVTPVTFQSGMSTEPATPQSAPADEQQEAPVPSGVASRQLSTAVLSAAEEANASVETTPTGVDDARTAASARGKVGGRRRGAVMVDVRKDGEPRATRRARTMGKTGTRASHACVADAREGDESARAPRDREHPRGRDAV